MDQLQYKNLWVATGKQLRKSTSIFIYKKDLQYGQDFAMEEENADGCEGGITRATQ
jgi:hypothetical protein